MPECSNVSGKNYMNATTRNLADEIDRITGLEAIAPVGPTEEDMLRAHGFAPASSDIYTPQYRQGYEDGFEEGGQWGAPFGIGLILGAVLLSLVMCWAHALGLWHFGA
jgi:hypothetical protein